MSRRRVYLGSFIGNTENKTDWLEDKCKIYAQAVSMLATVALKYPQTVYAGFYFCLQAEWQYVQRVVADLAIIFAPVERAITTELLPALLAIPLIKIDGNLRLLLAQVVKMGGLGIHNQADIAPYVHNASRGACSYLVNS